MNQVARDWDHPLARQARRAAVRLHRKCRGGTWCDCQHVTGRVIRKAYEKEK
jgi:hypothetical protein